MNQILCHRLGLKKIFPVNIFLLLLFSGVSGYTQQTSQLKAEGEYCGSSGESFIQIKKQAIQKAEQQALIDADIPQRVSSVNVLYEAQRSNNQRGQYNRVFSSVASSETQGKLLIDSVLQVKKYLNEFDHTCCRATIQATVFRYDSQGDPAFTFHVGDLEPGDEHNIPNHYNSGEHLSFEFQPNHDGYLKIFDITADTALMLYPYINKKYPGLSDPKHRLFQKGQKVQFPVNQALKPGYRVTLEKGKAREINHLIFVFTRKDVPFYGKVKKKKLFRWIYEIPPAEREVKYYPVLILAP